MNIKSDESGVVEASLLKASLPILVALTIIVDCYYFWGAGFASEDFDKVFMPAVKVFAIALSISTPLIWLSVKNKKSISVPKELIVLKMLSAIVMCVICSALVYLVL